MSPSSRPRRQLRPSRRLAERVGRVAVERLREHALRGGGECGFALRQFLRDGRSCRRGRDDGDMGDSVVFQPRIQRLGSRHFEISRDARTSKLPPPRTAARPERSLSPMTRARASPGTSASIDCIVLNENAASSEILRPRPCRKRARTRRHGRRNSRSKRAGRRSISRGARA